MKKHFYNHIIATQTVIMSLDNLDLSQKEKQHLLSLVEENLHFTILDTVLSMLTEEDKKLFLTHLHTNDHHKIWGFLWTWEKNIENIIRRVGEDLLKEFHKDIKQAQRK